jgi:predicted enzyme related to lactoylglutathione lyase
VPPHWLTYFAVAECDAAANKALKLGAIIRLDVPA